MLENAAAILPKTDWFKNSFEIDRLPVVAQTGINSIGDIHRVVYSIAESLRDKKPLGVEVSLGELVGQLESRLDFLEERHTLEERIALSAQINVAREGIQSLRAHAEWLAKEETRRQPTRPERNTITTIDSTGLERPGKVAEPATTLAGDTQPTVLRKEKTTPTKEDMLNTEIARLRRELDILSASAKHEKQSTGSNNLLLQTRIRQFQKSCEAVRLEQKLSLTGINQAPAVLDELIQEAKTLLEVVDAKLQSSTIELDGYNTEKLSVAMSAKGVPAGEYTVTSVLGSGKEGTVVLIVVKNHEEYNLPVQLVAKIANQDFLHIAKENSQFEVLHNSLWRIVSNHKSLPLTQEENYIPRSYGTFNDVTLMERVVGIPANELASVPPSVESLCAAVEMAHMVVTTDLAKILNKDPKDENLIVTDKGLMVIDLGTYVSLDGKHSTTAYISEATVGMKRQNIQLLIKFIANTCLPIQQRSLANSLIDHFGVKELFLLSKAERFEIGKQVKSELFAQLPREFQHIFLLAFELYAEKQGIRPDSEQILKLTFDLVQSTASARQELDKVNALLPLSFSKLREVPTFTGEGLTIRDFPSTPKLDSSETAELIQQKVEAFTTASFGSWFELLLLPGERMFPSVVGGSQFYDKTSPAAKEFVNAVENNPAVLSHKSQKGEMVARMKNVETDAESDRIAGEVEANIFRDSVYDVLLKTEIDSIDASQVDSSEREKILLKKYVIDAFLNLRRVIFNPNNFDQRFLIEKTMAKDDKVLGVLKQMDELVFRASIKPTTEQTAQFKKALNEKTRELLAYLLEKYGVKKFQKT